MSARVSTLCCLFLRRCRKHPHKIEQHHSLVLVRLPTAYLCLLGGFELAADKTVYPLRGALIRVVNDGSRFPIVKEALVVAHDYAKRDEDGGIVFIVPRNDRTLILGGKSSLISGA